jgi:hypothetical protein
MIRQNGNENFRNATFGAKQNRSNLLGLAALRLRARYARDGLSGVSSDDNNPNFPPDDGRGDSDSTPAC